MDKKFRYILGEAVLELGLSGYNASEFWISLIILLLALCIRAFTHTFGSWLILIICGVDINYITWGIKIEYSPTNVGHEIGVLLCGNLFTTLVFGLFILALYILL